MKDNYVLRTSGLILLLVMVNVSGSFGQWIINESFEGGTLPPSWNTYDVNGDNSKFRTLNKPSHAHSGNYICYVDCYDNDGNDWLVLPQVTVQSGDVFNFFARAWYGTENMQVKLSTTSNSMSNFTVTLGDVTGLGSTYQEFNYDLSSWAGQSIYLAIKWTQDTYAIIVDDIKVGKPMANDVGIMNINSPAGFSLVNQPVQPSAVVKNFGAGEMTVDFPVTCNITDELGNTVYNEQIQFTNTLMAGGTETILFPDWTPAEAGNHTVQIFTELEGDADETNDLLETEVEIVIHYGTGGPDAMSYSWIDSDEPGGPVYEWIEISSTGTSTIMYNVNTFSGDDNFSEAIPIGFSFPFYGISRTFFHADINGTLLLADNTWVTPFPANGWGTDGNIFNYYEYIPGYEGMPALISVFWDDLLAEQGTGDVYFQTFGTAPSRYTVIQWNNLKFRAGTGGAPTLCFQVILYENGEIKMQYKNVANGQTGGANPHDNGRSATIGIQNDDYSIGLAYLNENVDNGTYIGPDPAGNLLHNEMAIRFYPGVDNDAPAITCGKVWNTFENSANFTALITDMSGLASDSLYYNYGNGWMAVTHDSITHLNHYHYSISGIPTGSTVEYKYVATDNSEFSNRAEVTSTLDEPLSFTVLPTPGTEILVLTPGTLPGMQDYQNLELPKYITALTNAGVQFDIYNWTAYNTYEIPDQYEIIFGYANNTGTTAIHDTLAKALIGYLDSGTTTDPKNLFFASDNLTSTQYGLPTNRWLPKFTTGYLRTGFEVQANPPFYGGTDGLGGPDTPGFHAGSIIGIANSPIGSAGIELPVFADSPDVIVSRACPSWYEDEVANPEISSYVSFRFEDGPVSGNAYSKGNPCAVWLDNLIYKSFFLSFDISQISNESDIQTIIDEAIDWFTPDVFTVTLEAMPGDGGTLTGEGLYEEGTTATVTATPTDNYEFLNWMNNGTMVSTNPVYSFTVTGDVTLTANFELITDVITLIANPTEGGTVTGAGTYMHGIDVTIKAIPADDYEFVNWTSGTEIISEEPEYTLTLISDTTLVANFELLTPNYVVIVSANPEGGGTVTGAGTYVAGTEVTVTATEALNFEFDYWAEDGDTLSTERSYTFIIEADRELTAYFKDVTATDVRIMSKISINPNPAGDFIIITNSGMNDEGIRNIEVFNSMGIRQNLKFTQIGNDALTLDISTYPAGFYILRFTINNGDIRTATLIHKR